MYEKIIFVCNDNTCRSPMAAAILKSILRVPGIQVLSRGLVVLFPEPYNPKAAAILRGRGIPLGNGESAALDAADFGENTLVLTMDREQQKKILDDYPAAMNVFSIMEYAGGAGDIMDPYGGDMDVYALFYEAINTWVVQVENKLYEEYRSKKGDNKMIALGSDHGGYDLKVKVMEHLAQLGLEYKDFGTYDKNSCDYPVYGRAAAEAVADGSCDRGIVICTTGIGISITANKVKGIRCALCTSTYQAEMTRLHNDANMLALGANTVSEELAMEIVDKFLNTAYSNEERHTRRINLIEN